MFGKTQQAAQGFKAMVIPMSEVARGIALIGKENYR
jgi:hypothetical protein